VTMEPTPLNKI